MGEPLMGSGLKTYLYDVDNMMIVAVVKSTSNPIRR